MHYFKTESKIFAHVVIHVANDENERAVVHFVLQQAAVERRERKAVMLAAVAKLPNEALQSQRERACHLHSTERPFMSLVNS